MLVRELKKVLNKNQMIEVSTPIYFYYGKVRNINKKVLDLEVYYLSSGIPYSNFDETNCILVDAYRKGE